MNEEQIRKIAKETFVENIMNNLDSSIVFKYIQELEQENKKYKEVIDKAKKLHNEFASKNSLLVFENNNLIDFMNNLISVLKEVE